MSALSKPLTLPCGAVLPNRIAKGAMTEGLADLANRATPELAALYRIWGEGGSGMLLTGNVQVDGRYLERPGNVVIEGTQSEQRLDALKTWAKAAQAGGSTIWMQISHAGRQTPASVAPEPVGPSAVTLKMPGGLFGTPRALSGDEIEDIIARFAHTASVAKKCGFDGIQVHSAHGYLLSEFLNPLANLRRDKWGGSLENRARLLRRVVQAIRKKVGPKFPIGVKLNSSDFQKGGFTFEECKQVAAWLVEDGVDLLEISGGNYEQPAMVGVRGAEKKQEDVKQASTKAREAYFLDYAKQLLDADTPPLMVTGGFRTAEAMEQAVSKDGISIIGVARPLCVDPAGPGKLLADEIEALDDWENRLQIGPGVLSRNSRFNLIRSINGWGVQGWFCLQIMRMGRGLDPDSRLGVLKAFLKYQADEKKAAQALAEFRGKKAKSQ
jgi:2,4-dienoyl-CoA reductase-like NADH-dependent reductase (Old Yellow Enzyme family)